MFKTYSLVFFTKSKPRVSPLFDYTGNRHNRIKRDFFFNTGIPPVFIFWDLVKFLFFSITLDTGIFLITEGPKDRFFSETGFRSMCFFFSDSRVGLSAFLNNAWGIIVQFLHKKADMTK